MRRKDGVGKDFRCLRENAFAVSSNRSLPVKEEISIFLDWLFRVSSILLSSLAFRLHNKEFGRCAFCGRETWGVLTKLPISLSANQCGCRVWDQTLSGNQEPRTPNEIREK